MFRALFMFVVFIFVANAKEMSGFFGGVELGYGFADLITKETRYESVKLVSGGGQTTTNSNTKNTTQSDYWYGNVTYGILAGYKQFFNKYFGLRYYADLSFLNVDFPITEIGIPNTTRNQSGNGNTTTITTREVTTTQTAATLMNYTANVDALVNFVNLEKVIFGVFAGVGIGGFTWIEQSQNYTNLFFATNVGLRTSILQNHSVEFVVRIPIVSEVQDKYPRTNIKDSKLVSGGGQTTTTTMTDIEILDSRKQSWNLALRYIYSF